MRPSEERAERTVKALERIADALERLAAPCLPYIAPPVDQGPTPDVPPYPGEVVIYGCQPDGGTVPVPGGRWYTTSGTGLDGDPKP